MKNQEINTKGIILAILITTLLTALTLSTSFAANQTIDDTTTGGIRGAITNTSVNPGDTIFLQPGTYNKAGNDTGVTISKNITIQGNSSTNDVIIDAQGLNRIFTIGNGYNVTFINITFINGGGATNGGAIWNNYAGTTMTFINCTFDNNSASYGGVIYNRGPNLSVVNCTFNNNGGGTGNIYLVGGSINTVIANCTFTNNFRPIQNDVDNNLSVVNCIFINNSYTGSVGGAAIYSSASLSIDNCTFVNNSAGGHGGAIRTISVGYLFINNSTFINNTASASAGAIYSDGILSMDNCIFDNNRAGTQGGAVFHAPSNINATINNCTFTNNQAIIKGGAISNNGVNSTVINCYFRNNNATDGGAISNNGVNSTVINCYFVDNNAKNFGGAIFNNRSLSVSGNVMTGNSAGLGQMIYNNGTMGVLNLTYLSNSTVKTSKGSTVTVYATLTDDMGNTVTGQDISFYVDGVFIANVASIEGKANITYLVTKGPVSVLPVTGDYASHDGYSIVLKNGELLVPKIPTNITVSVPKEVKVGDTVTIESKLTDKDGNPIANATVDFCVDGKKIGSAVTDKNGIAKIKYTFTKAGEPNVVAKYAGNDTYLASNATNQTTVSKIKTKITIKVKGNKVTATLTDENGNLLVGKKITFRVKGVIIGVGITDANGQVTIYYKNAEQNTITATFAGDNRYEPSNATSTPTKSKDVQASEKVAMKETGIPIMAVLLVLLTSIGLLSYKKRR